MSTNSEALPRRVIDIAGRRFGRFVVVSFNGLNRHKRALWLCQCDCGTEKVVPYLQLKTGDSVSCGCYHRENAPKWMTAALTRHGRSKTVEYNTWSRLVARCTNPRNKKYPRYGGRGISVCERWSGEQGFENFLADMGERPANCTSIDRRDNDGNYEPGNCRWTTATVQSRNNPHTKLTFEKAEEMRARMAAGETATAVARAFGVSKPTACSVRDRRTWAAAV